MWNVSTDVVLNLCITYTINPLVVTILILVFVAIVADDLYATSIEDYSDAERAKRKRIKKTAATQLSATKWTYIYVHFFTWHSFFLLLYDVDHNVIFCDVAATVAPIIAVGCVMTFLSTQWTRKFVFDYCLSLVMKSNIPASFGLSHTFTPFFLFAPFFSFAPVFLFAPSIPDYLFFRQNFPFKIIEMVEWAWCSHSWCHRVS